ncbi:MAG: prolyl oligopeptidase family serine peptidase, partial [Bacteroidales bacterium]|nr:prolyl oligopeptidase family serine peptidase [Bacteroidales bacterium]
VALCGCHDNRMDKIWWNEQWMGYPTGPWYAESSNVDNAYRLTGKLLLINGELDDNVDPASTLQVVDALIKANKDFEQLYLPGHSHSLGSEYITRRVFEFFYRNMMMNREPDPVPMAEYDEKPVITAPPVALNLNSFYKKYMNVNGIHVASSWRVPDSVYQAAYVTLRALTEALPSDVMESLTSRNTRLGIMARYEGTTDIPEHARLVRDTTINWDLRARGLGGTLRNPFSTCAEENILAYQIDKYHAEDIMIHEFAHTIHNVGISPVYPGFNDELQAALDAALAEGKYAGTYAGTNIEEYFAEGVQNWFNVNAEVPAPDGKHNKVNTREEMKRYDPRLYGILSRFFPELDLQISKHKKINLYNQE